MYRKRNGSIGFSFTRFAHAAVPNFFADEAPSSIVNLSGYLHDMCYVHQITSANPYALDERTFYVAGVVDKETLSKKVFAKLKKHQILREDNTVDTYQIGPKFVHQLAILDVRRQKELIDLLFWWEEECQRLRKLDAEEKELDTLISESESQLTATEQGDDDLGVKATLDQLKFARERVRMKRRQRPSQRQPDVEADTDDIMMAFHGRSKSVPNIASPGSGAAADPPAPVAQQSQPPQYFAST